MLGVEVVICYTSQVKALVYQISYGIEEEGLPYKLIETQNDFVYEQADQAANSSALDVGIGLSSKKIAIRNSRFEKGVYLFDHQISDIEDLKAYGANAARLIKGVPFKKI